MKYSLSTISLAVLFSFSANAFAAKELPARLAGHVILPGDTKVQAPADAPNDLKVNGKFHEAKRTDKLGGIEGKSNGRPTGINFPFEGQPVQGHSGIVNMQDGTFWILTDNGLGNKLNSSDSALFFRHYKIDFDEDQWEALETVFLKDPNKVIPFRITHEDTKERYLTGSDFDPESIQVIGDNFWIWEEFGPYLLKLDRQGNVQSVFDTLLDGKVISSPDRPGMILPGAPDGKLLAFQAKRSKGFEGMAASPDGSKLYPLLEGALWDADKAQYEQHDGKSALRIFEFDVKDEKYTGKTWLYPMEDAKHSIGDFNMIDGTYGLIIERDETEGTQDKACKDGQDKTQCFDQPANFKRVYKIKLDPSKDAAEKIAYIDLMNIQDPNKKAKRDLVDGKFVFPFFTIENVDFVGDNFIIVGNDNNYPKSSSREPNKADDNELLLLDVKELREAK